MQEDLEFFVAFFFLIHLLHGYQPSFLSKPIHVFLLTECKNPLNAKYAQNLFIVQHLFQKTQKKIKEKEEKQVPRTV